MELRYFLQFHPSRVALLPRLLRILPTSATFVIRDPDPDAALKSSWRTYRACLERAAASDASHAVVVQDDAIPCEDFPTVLKQAVAAQPDRLLVLCVCGNGTYAVQQIRRAQIAGEPWVSLHRNQFVPTVGLVWPLRLIRPLLDHIDAQNWPTSFHADDGVVGRAVRDLSEVPLATVPSLLDHRDDVPSLVGERARNGVDPGRVTVCFAEGGAADVDWTIPPGIY